MLGHSCASSCGAKIELVVSAIKPTLKVFTERVATVEQRRWIGGIVNVTIAVIDRERRRNTIEHAYLSERHPN